MLTFLSCLEVDNINQKIISDSVVNCQEDCPKSCCLGCKATEGDKKCLFLPDGSMPCCL